MKQEKDWWQKSGGQGKDLLEIIQLLNFLSNFSQGLVCLWQGDVELGFLFKRLFTEGLSFTVWNLMGFNQRKEDS